MTTNFALSLSFEGIELLHRVTRGWKRVGGADVEDENLDAVLARLREKALGLDPSGIRSKLIIPMDQIKYLAIDSTQTTLDDVHAALEGATPYDLDDLVIDYERSGGRTHIAAVTKETLQEAESFASAHQFNPVAFVAVPEPFTFQKEVFFGPTSIANEILDDGVLPERDQLPVMKVGTRVKSRLLVMAPIPDAPDESDLLNDLAPPVTVETPAAIVVPPEPPVSAPKAPALAQPKLLDRIISEHHAGPIPAPAPVVAKRNVVVANPSFASTIGLHPAIREIYPERLRREKPVLRAITPLKATSASGPKLTATKTQTASTAQKGNRTVVITAIAASAAAAALFAWWQWAPQASPSTTQEIVEAPAVVAPVDAPNVIAEVTVEDRAPEAHDLQVARMSYLDVGPSDVILPAEITETSTARPVPLAIVSADVGVAPTLFTASPPPPATQDPLSQDAETPRVTGRVLSPAEAQAAYEATGVWQRAPRFVDSPRIEAAANVDLPSEVTAAHRGIQPDSLTMDGPEADQSFLAPNNPPAADVSFALDESGQIIPSEEGTPTPQGAVVFAGLPNDNLRVRPELTEEQRTQMEIVANAPDGVVVIAGRPAITPPTRPEYAALPQDDAPQEDTATAGAVTLDALTDDAADQIAEDTLRPQSRPDGLVPVSPTPDPGTPDITAILESVIAEGETDPFVAPTAQAVASSVRPTLRPRNFDRVVAAARERQATQPAPAAAPPVAASVAPQNYAPVPGGVARAATQDGVIRLRDLNLIGIYGRPNAPRALVRLGNGRYQHVEVGSSLDGGQVTAIGNGVLNYVKRGRTVVLELPGG
ncbi:hypothetical protein [Loktanella sp. S4079]|uniref:hypothetical protein n=1 Tax=Loktanella sp. S4079 TaxID=579483 RepID=UPI0005FA5FD9|nr:hypothetical protein [Loktanella sp. S4079]KJZ20536.1 hypothetical protein TW80_07070 [Loktanella sp. S4079]